MKIAIVVPFYNEEKNILHFINEWTNLLLKIKSIKIEFIFIDDGSSDNTSELIKSKCKNIKFEIIIKENTGHGDSCRLGYEYAIKKNVDYILQLDSDNQCNPIYFKKFLSSLKKNNSVFGRRVKREDGYLRLIISRLLSLMVYIKTGNYVCDMNCPYKIFPKKELKEILFISKAKYKNKIKLFNCVIAAEFIKKYPVKWVDIKFRKRKYGLSKYNFISMLTLFINLILKIK